MLSWPLFLLVVPTVLSRPELATLVSWFQRTCLSTGIFQMSVVLLTWKSDQSSLSASTWLLKQAKLLCVPSFSPSEIIVTLFCLAAHFTFSEDYKTLRTQIMQKWSCTTSSSSTSLATGPRQSRWQIINFLSQLLSIILCLPLWPSHCVHTFQTTSFCTHMEISHPPC